MTTALPQGLRIVSVVDAADNIIVQGASYDYQIAAGTFATQISSLAPNPSHTTLYVGASAIVASAIGQFDSTTKGILPPRMTTTQRDAIVSPAEGLVIYNTSTHALNVYNGTSWKEVTVA